MRLSCGAAGNPAPEITWLRQDGMLCYLKKNEKFFRIPQEEKELELVTAGADLVLSPVTKEDRGQESSDFTESDDSS